MEEKNGRDSTLADISLRTHLARLVELEYVLAYRTGPALSGNTNCSTRAKADTEIDFSWGLFLPRSSRKGRYDDNCLPPRKGIRAMGRVNRALFERYSSPIRAGHNSR